MERPDISNTTHPSPKEFFRPNRGWFIAPAGAIALYLLGRLNDIPLWLVGITLAVLIVCAAIWPWIEASRKRQLWFWPLFGLYALAVVIVAFSARPAPESRTTDVVKQQPAPIVQLQPTPTITPLSTPTPAPSPTPSAPKSRSKRSKVSQRKVTPCRWEDRMQGQC